MTRSIITSLTLKEISAVDRPAQIGAKMTIMKRAGEQTIMKAAKSFSDTLRERLEREAEWKAADKLYPITGALTDAIGTTAADTTLSDDEKRVRIEADLNDFLAAMKDKVPDITSVVSEIIKSSPDYAALLPAGSTGPTPVAKGVSTMTDKPTVESLTKSLADMQVRAETAEVIAKMSDAEKAHLATLSEDDKKKFLAMSADDRAKLVKKSADAEETVVVEGQTIAKSAVGAATFAVMKAQAARMAEIEKAAAADRDTAELVRLEKRATDELANLPGETVAKAKVLKAVNAMGEADRATLDAMLKAGNSALAKAFTTVGTRTAAEVDVAKRRDDIVSKIATEEKVTKSRAMELAVQRNPELFTASAA